MLIMDIPAASGVISLKGHDIMDIARFDEGIQHMIVFEVLAAGAAVGLKGDGWRLFLDENGYRKALAEQEQGLILIRNHAGVLSGHLVHDNQGTDM